MIYRVRHMSWYGISNGCGYKKGAVHIQLCSYETAAGPVYEGKWALFKVV